VASDCIDRSNADADNFCYVTLANASNPKLRDQNFLQKDLGLAPRVLLSGALLCHVGTMTQKY
jgi:hypothetical protein